MVFVLICANHFNSIFEYYIRQLRRIFLSRGKRPKWMIEIAIERMNILFERAEMEFITHPERSHRYVELARKLSTKYNTKIPEKWSRRYCRECGKFLYYGHNSSVRLVDEKVNIFCGECGHVMKIPYNKEKKIKRRNDNVIEEIKRQLKANEIVKLKFAKNIARDKDTYIAEIVEKTRCKLIDVRGHVAVIYKKKP